MHRGWNVLLLAGVIAVMVAGLSARQSDPPAQKPGSQAGQKAAPGPAGTPDGQKPTAAKPAAAQAGGKTERPAREQTPEMKALAEARKIEDADKKIDALRQVIKDYPSTDAAEVAQSQILSALVGKIKDAGKAALQQANAMVEATPEGSRWDVYATLAASLSKEGVLLEEAEAFGRKGLELMTEEAFQASTKKDFADRAAQAVKRNPDAKPFTPSEDQLGAMFKSQRQSALVTLGEICASRGKVAEAETFLKQGLELDPRSGASAATAALRLAGFAKAAGRDAEQLEFLTRVALLGRLTPEARADFEAAYRKSHGGSLDGIEETLDARYERESPRAIEVKPYTRPAGNAGRVVLAELFTGAGCPPCVGIDYAFEAALERYKPEDLALIVYHVHVPRPDPMANPSTIARQALYGANGVPAFYLDGVTDGKGGGAAESAPSFYRDRVEPVVDRRLAAKPDAKVALQATMAGPVVQVKVAVSGVRSAAQKLKLHLVLVEERVRYSGENGVRFHPMVVRAMAGKDASGFPVDAGKGLKLDQAFDLDKVVADAAAHLDDFEKTSTRFPNHKFAVRKHEVDRKKVAVVAFVQDEETKAILQAAYVKPRQM
jgi:tetratricopeptide (TPR) repeat protein